MSGGQRSNPRQRWHEGDSHGLGWDMQGSTVAGVSLTEWLSILQSAEIEIRTPITRSSAAEQQQYAADDALYQGVLIEFSEQLRQVVREIEQGARDWVSRPRLKARRGRGAEITVVARDYGSMRNFLTNASLGTPRDDERFHLVLDRLDKSADRRENTWDYRDKSLGELSALRWGELALSRRRAAIKSDIKFRKMMDDILGSKKSPAEQVLGALTAVKESWND